MSSLIYKVWIVKRNYLTGLLELKRYSKEHEPLVIGTYQIDDYRESWVPISHSPNKSILSLFPGKVRVAHDVLQTAYYRHSKST